MSIVKTLETNKIGILLATLFVFSQHGKEEVSLSEFQESIAKFQENHPLGYVFSKQFLLSTDLLQDLTELDYGGYIRDYHHRLDSLLPKRFLSLTPLGRGKGKSAYESFTDILTEDLENAVTMGIKNYSERWRLWSR